MKRILSLRTKLEECKDRDSLFDSHYESMSRYLSKEIDVNFKFKKLNTFRDFELFFHKIFKLDEMEGLAIEDVDIIFKGISFQKNRFFDDNTKIRDALILFLMSKLEKYDAEIHPKKFDSISFGFLSNFIMKIQDESINQLYSGGINIDEVIVLDVKKLLIYVTETSPISSVSIMKSLLMEDKNFNIVSGIFAEQFINDESQGNVLKKLKNHTLHLNKYRFLGECI